MLVLITYDVNTQTYEHPKRIRQPLREAVS